MDPWLDQAVLPLVIHSLGGGRPGPALDGLDGDVTCHYRRLPLLYARDPEAAAGALRDHLSHIEHILERLRIDQPGILA